MCGIVEYLRKMHDLVPCRMIWHRQVMLRKNLLIVHHKATLTVKREGVWMFLIRKGRHDWLEKIIVVVATLILSRHLVKIRGEVLQPSVVRPDRRFVTPDSGNVKLARIGRDILRHL